MIARRPPERRSPPGLHLDPEHLQGAEQPDRVHLRPHAERDVRRVRDGLAEGGIDRDPLTGAPHLRPGVPVERGSPSPYCAYTRPSTGRAGIPERARERDEEDGVLGAVALPGRETSLARSWLAPYAFSSRWYTSSASSRAAS